MATVLLVEDDAGILKNLSEYLCAEGFKIETARGQAEAIEKLAENKVDLALLDVSLADGNGFSVCRLYQSELFNSRHFSYGVRR